jgi:hypothetical protein
MTLADIDKWISGEIETFFNPLQAPASVAADNKPGEKNSTARPSMRKFGRPAIAAVVGALVSSALVCFAISMPQSIESFSAAYAKLHPSNDDTTSIGVRGDADGFEPVTKSAEITPALAMEIPNQPTATLSDTQVTAFLRDARIWYERRAEAAQRPDRKPSPFSDAQLAAFLSQVRTWYERRTEAAQRPERKPSPPQRALQQHGPR